MKCFRWFHWTNRGPSWSWSYESWTYNYLCNQCLSSLMLWVRISIRARCATICDKVCQWLATGRWFSPGPPVSSTNKTDRYDIAEILLKVALDTIKQTIKQTLNKFTVEFVSFWTQVTYSHACKYDMNIIIEFLARFSFCTGI